MQEEKSNLKDLLCREYYELLCRAVLLAANSERYAVLHAKYDSLREELNSFLSDVDSPVSDITRTIDKQSGKIKPAASLILAEHPELSEKLQRLSEIYSEMLTLSHFKWDEGLAPAFDTVLAISAYKRLEDKIISTFGSIEGKRLIYAEKKRVLLYEASLGVSFFAEEVEKHEATEKISLLISDTEISLCGGDSLAKETVILKNKSGESFPFEICAFLYLSGALYVELMLLFESKAPKFNYYKLEKTLRGYRLVLVDEPNLLKTLDAKRDAITV